MNTPLSSFTALVKFQFDRTGLTSEIAAVRKQLQGLTGRTLGVKLKYDKGSLNLPSFINQTVKLKYVGEKQPTSPLTQNRLIRDIPLPSSLPKPEPRTNKVTSELLKVKLQASTLSLKDAKLTHVPKIKLTADSLSLKEARIIHVPKVKLTASSLSLKGVRVTDIPRINTRGTTPSSGNLSALTRQQKLEDKIARDRTAAALKAQRIAERNLAAEERALLRAQRAEERRYQQWFQQREREDRATQRSLEQRQRAEQRSQDRTTREHQRQITQRANEEIRQLRRVRTTSGGGGSGGSGGSPNPWHMGTMAGGLGGLITRGNLAAVGAGAFTQQSFTQANFDVAQAPQFEFITGSAEEAAKQVAFLNKEVDRLSLPLRETSNMYRQLLASTKKGLGIEKTQELFSSFSDISTMLGLSSDAQQRGLRSFAQMASKGQVMS